MITVSRDEAKLCVIQLLDAFPRTNLTVVSQVFSDPTLGERLYVVGDDQYTQALHPHMYRLLGKGMEEGYVWSGVNPLGVGRLELVLDNLSNEEIPRLELVERVFRRDAIRFARLQLSHGAVLRVSMPWDQRVLQTGYIGLPLEENGDVVIA